MCACALPWRNVNFGTAFLFASVCFGLRSPSHYAAAVSQSDREKKKASNLALIIDNFKLNFINYTKKRH